MQNDCLNKSLLPLAIPTKCPIERASDDAFAIFCIYMHSIYKECQMNRQNAMNWNDLNENLIFSRLLVYPFLAEFIIIGRIKRCTVKNKQNNNKKNF